MTAEIWSVVYNLAAWTGFGTWYALIGVMTYAIVKEIYNEDDFAIMMGIVWPMSIVVGLVWLLGMYVGLPFFAARKSDVKRVENKVQDIKEDVSTIKNKIGISSPSTKPYDITITPPQASAKKFKVDDIVTGLPGNPGKYKHLYEGCRCKVLSITDKGSMQLILLDHNDKDAHKKHIGKIFKAPAKYFQLVQTDVPIEKVQQTIRNNPITQRQRRPRTRTRRTTRRR